MQTNILWTGQEYYSLENCLVNTTDRGYEINSAIVGKYGGKIYRVEYTIKTNQNWETLLLELFSQHSDHREQLLLEGDGNGNWKVNGKQADEFMGCIDIDISLTPFTNTLPINRLKLSKGSEQKIQVIYFGVLEQRMKSVMQKYVRLSEAEYHYENIPNDFESNIKVDELGLVVDYPSLFTRTAIVTTKYAVGHLSMQKRSQRK